MALSDILDAMDAEAGAELAQIARREQETVAQLRAAACAQVEAMRIEHRQAAIAPMRRERARRLNRARLSAQRAASRARVKICTKKRWIWLKRSWWRCVQVPLTSPFSRHS